MCITLSLVCFLHLNCSSHSVQCDDDILHLISTDKPKSHTGTVLTGSPRNGCAMLVLSCCRARARRQFENVERDRCPGVGSNSQFNGECASCVEAMLHYLHMPYCLLNEMYRGWLSLEKRTRARNLTSELK